ncbi:N-acetylglucosaminyl-phosphatidylinositol biosynthetic protein [Echinococcus granulosus]|uniref:N-acetylglucosaminyl-phosphatidylinositol biosynthetic protein n=1 Tax=Echinococcus granulosus TaxID=6210 RepID=W6U8Z7_ECHGR|nr:N-acetylglucosaminyl-phosphatidylinositol biosynthetic protein [Echinococcus granulosus]EUB57863.1 N-acetylglucosaminyl-phosphatidylinositol biosynthetic protein [Echinococcus granulosus]
MLDNMEFLEKHKAFQTEELPLSTSNTISHFFICLRLSAILYNRSSRRKSTSPNFWLIWSRCQAISFRVGSMEVVGSHRAPQTYATYHFREGVSSDLPLSSQTSKQAMLPRELLRADKSAVYYIPYRSFYGQTVFVTVFGGLTVVRDILVRESVDVVHGHSAFSPLALESLMHAKALGLRALFTDHSLFGFADLSSILANRALFMSLNVVDNFICVSHVAKENTVLRGGIEPERVYVIPNAIDPRAFTPDPARRDPDNITVVVVSRLVYRKGADLLAAIIPPLCSTFPKLRFIIGGDGPKRLALEEMRERHNLHFRVEMLGALPNHKIRDVLVCGDIFLNVSLTESFCIAIVEAASCGLLVVSTKVGGVPEVLPPHMIRLSAVSASGLASTLADAIEEVRQQRLQWSQEASLTRSVSIESQASVAGSRWMSFVKQSDAANQRQSLRRSRSVSLERMNERKEVESGTSMGLGGPRIRLSQSSSWPSASAVEMAWQRHRQIRLCYTWGDVTRRTEIAYQAAMSRPRITPKDASIAYVALFSAPSEVLDPIQNVMAYQRLGPVCGIIVAIGWMIEWIFIILLEWFKPSNTIDRVPYFATTSWQFDMWNQSVISPYEEMKTTSILGSTPKRCAFKQKGATSTACGDVTRTSY